MREFTIYEVLKQKEQTDNDTVGFVSVQLDSAASLSCGGISDLAPVAVAKTTKRIVGIQPKQLVFAQQCLLLDLPEIILQSACNVV